MVAQNPAYRNNRKNFYQEKGPDTVSVGTIINVFKTKASKNSYDSNYLPSTVPVNGTTSYVDSLGNGYPENNPEYQYRGYLYCDGSEYNIKDYPLLYAAIGNEYGGTPGQGVTVLTQGSGYSSNTTATFSAAPTGGVTATGTVTVSSGNITSITLIKPGAGYTSPPTITLANTGGGVGATFSVRINSEGSVTGITQENVFEFWPEENLGTFNVPDLLAKKIVGYGPVYGSGSPTIGNIEMQVGLGSVGGYWYFSKNSQKGYFNLGTVKTTGYTDVIGTVTGTLTGSQVVTVTLTDNDLPGPPQHVHQLLHSEAPNVQGFPGTSAYDPYLTGYKNKNGKILPFSPAGSIKLTHSHALSKKRLSGQNIATYDLFNYSGGDAGPGTKKSNGNFYASGSSGQFVDVTYTPTPLFKKFDGASVVGGRTINNEGQPVYETNEYLYTTAGDYSFSLPTGIDNITVTAIGGGGSGGVYTQAGNAGTATIVKLGDGSALTITANGGNPGGASSEVVSGSLPYLENGGTGGNGGTCVVSGTLAASFSISYNPLPSDASIKGGNGVTGKNWKVQYPTGPGADAFGNDLFEGLKGGIGPGSGSNGKYLYVSASANGTTLTTVYPNTANFGIAVTDPQKYSITSAFIELYGARGLNCQNLGGAYTTGVGQYSTNAGGCTTGVGGPGKYIKLSKKADGGVISGTFGFYPGQSGRSYNGSAAATYGTATGGSAGDGYLQDGGGGAAGTAVTTIVSGGATTIVAGAGGGGGGGGAGEGNCGDNATGNGINDGAQALTQSIFSGAGGVGGTYGCTGGGGGGGGGGYGTSTQTGAAQGGGDGAGGNGGPGGGGGGNGGHGGGYGGARGLTSYRSDFFDLVAAGDSNSTEGKIVGTTIEDRSYYSSSAGGGGSGGYIIGVIPKTLLTASAASAITFTVGTGGAGVSKSLSRTVDGSISWVENASTVSSDKASDGQVKLVTKKVVGTFGGTATVTVGDIVVKASDGIEIYTSGSGSGTAGGFKLPVNQVPVVQILAQGSQPGSGATATCTVSNSVVSSISLTAGGSGYTSAPKVRFLHGCGSGTLASTTINSSGVVNTLALQNASSTAYTHYVKFGGPELERYIVVGAVDCTNVEKFGVKACRGNDLNGGEKPDDSGDQLLLYYNTDGSESFPDSNFIGVLVPKPSDAEIASNYDGTGTGTNPTNWYTYFLNIPAGAQTSGVRFKIVQKRVTPSGVNDNGGNNDHFGICDFIYDYKFISETQFQSTPGEVAADAQTLSYTIEGNNNSLYPAGVEVNDITFTLTAGTPLTPTPALDPIRSIPLLEPYALTKYLIKAF